MMVGLRWRLALVILAGMLLCGCSVKLAYNNADRLAVWQADDFVDLSSAQKDWIRTRTRIYLHWHRTRQLPLWAAALRELRLDIADGIDEPALLELAERAEGWGDEMIYRYLPTVTEVLLALEAEQIDALPEAFERNNAELNEDYEGLSEAAQRRVWREEVADFLGDWIGRLTPGQQLLLETTSEQVVPDNAGWVAYRRRWQEELLAQLRRKDRDPEYFRQAFFALGMHYEAFWTAEYQRIRELNEPLYRRFMVDLLGSLEPRQYERLAERLEALADDLDELAAEAGTPPPDPGPFPAFPVGR